jgi:hypothetical protein
MIFAGNLCLARRPAGEAGALTLTHTGGRARLGAQLQLTRRVESSGGARPRRAPKWIVFVFEPDRRHRSACRSVGQPFGTGEKRKTHAETVILTSVPICLFVKHEHCIFNLFVVCGQWAGLCAVSWDEWGRASGLISRARARPRLEANSPIRTARSTPGRRRASSGLTDRRQRPSWSL